MKADEQRAILKAAGWHRSQRHLSGEWWTPPGSGQSIRLGSAWARLRREYPVFDTSSFYCTWRRELADVPADVAPLCWAKFDTAEERERHHEEAHPAMWQVSLSWSRG